MKSINRTARIVGALYIIGTVAGILSYVFGGPVLFAQDHLTNVPGNEIRLAVGALFVLTMGLALAMVPVLMFPILRRHNEALALGYVVFRSGLEAVGYFASVAMWLLMVPLSQLYVQAAASDASIVKALGNLWLEASLGIIGGSINAIVFSLGSLIFNYLLYKTRLIPRWLSVWGLIAGVVYLAAGLLPMFSIIEALGPIYNVLNSPKGLQEMVLAVWLIVKGFNPSATVFGTAEATPNSVQMSPAKV